MEKKLNENISPVPCNEQTLVEYLRKVADAHGVEFIDKMADEYQVLLKSESIPVLADVKSVVDAFCFGVNRGSVECDWGYITVYMDELHGLYRDEVDMKALENALPRGTVEINETNTNKNMKKNVVKVNESTLRQIVAESVKRILKEAVNGGWEVKDDEAFEAYDFACDAMGKETVNDAIVRCLGKEQLASCLAYVFRQYDFRDWENRNEVVDDEEI